MHVPHGPYRVSQNGQLSLGKDVREAVGIEPGDAVYLVPHDDPEGTILIVPVEIALQWFERGRHLERAEDASPDRETGA